MDRFERFRVSLDRKRLASVKRGKRRWGDYEAVAAAVVVAALGLLLSTVGLLAAPPALAAAPAGTIASAGPLTKIFVSPDLNCAVDHTGDSHGEFYNDTACGTFVAVGSTTYGPATIPAGPTRSRDQRLQEVHQGEPERGERHRHRGQPVQDHHRRHRRQHGRAAHPDRHLCRGPGVVPHRRRRCQHRADAGQRRALPGRRLLPAERRQRIRQRRRDHRRRVVRERGDERQRSEGPRVAGRAVAADHGRQPLRREPVQHGLGQRRVAGAIPEHLHLRDVSGQRRRPQLEHDADRRRRPRPVRTC